MRTSHVRMVCACLVLVATPAFAACDARSAAMVKFEQTPHYQKIAVSMRKPGDLQDRISNSIESVFTGTVRYSRMGEGAWSGKPTTPEAEAADYIKDNEGSTGTCQAGGTETIDVWLAWVPDFEI